MLLACASAVHHFLPANRALFAYLVTRSHFISQFRALALIQLQNVGIGAGVPNYFTSNPEFLEFELENAIVVLPQDRPQNSKDWIGGLTYAGITESYTIYLQQPGDFQLPAAEITVPFASAPLQDHMADLRLPALLFMPEGACRWSVRQGRPNRRWHRIPCRIQNH